MNVTSEFVYQIKANRGTSGIWCFSACLPFYTDIFFSFVQDADEMVQTLPSMPPKQGCLGGHILAGTHCEHLESMKGRCRNPSVVVSHHPEYLCIKTVGESEKNKSRLFESTWFTKHCSTAIILLLSFLMKQQWKSFSSRGRYQRKVAKWRSRPVMGEFKPATFKMKYHTVNRSITVNHLFLWQS